MAHFTKTFHRKTYPAISSSSPNNSALGRTVLVTGATSGIGSAISHAFMNAGASKIILTGRKQATLATTIGKLEEIRPPRCETKLLTHENDLADQASTQALWKTLAEVGTAVDILILNAAARWSGPLRNSSKELWSLFETDVLGNLRMSESFLNQGPDNGKVSRGSKAKELLELTCLTR
jgi:NADP-dependent 3-hydroxy acid dehydrogenase YdfG